MRKLAIEECRQLKFKISQCPRAETIAKAIEINRSLNDFKACEKIARRWGRRFKESWILQFSIAKYLFQRSLVENDPRISQRCLAQLELAASLKPTNYKTLLYLATLLHQLGKTAPALAAAQKLLAAYPNDPRATALIGYISQAGRGTAGAAVEPSRRADRAADSGDLVEPIFEELKANPAVLAILFQRFSAPTHESAETEEGLAATVERRPSDDRVHFTQGEALHFERGREAFGDLIHSLQLSSHRMGIGKLRGCTLEGGSWNIFFGAYDGGQYLLCTEKSFKEERFLQIQERLCGVSAPA
jgi:tetratricopeptide (TPR) repeat protein